jgi:hypothetical protein
VDETPLTEAELRVRASALMRSLQTAVDDAKAGGEPAQVAAAQRLLVQALPVLARLTPEDPTDNGDKVLVSAAEIATEAATVRAKLHDMLTRALAKSS